MSHQRTTTEGRTDHRWSIRQRARPHSTNSRAMQSNRCSLRTVIEERNKRDQQLLTPTPTQALVGKATSAYHHTCTYACMATDTAPQHAPNTTQCARAPVAQEDSSKIRDGGCCKSNAPSQAKNGSVPLNMLCRVLAWSTGTPQDRTALSAGMKVAWPQKGPLRLMPPRKGYWLHCFRNWHVSNQV